MHFLRFFYQIKSCFYERHELPEGYDDATDEKVYWEKLDCYSTFTIIPNCYRNQDVIGVTFGNNTLLLSFYFDLEDINENIYNIHTIKTFNCKKNENKFPFSKWPIKDDECKLILKFDGDYLYVYINDLMMLYGVFCRINSKTLDEYNNLIRTGKCNLSNVTWPRHADGSCDYDGISSNWVKVEVQKGAKDRDGKPIKAGLVGWAYGGYLE